MTVDQVRFLQNGEVLREGRLGHVEMFGQLPGGHVPIAKQLEDAPASGIGQRLVDAVQVVRPSSN